jgi:hypothetical protein
MVICPVGNRCKACADKTASHSVKVTPGVLLRTGVSTLVVGALFGLSLGSLPGFGFYSWIFVYFIGVFVGNVLHKISGYKLGKTITSVVAGCLLVGAIASECCVNAGISSITAVSSQQLAAAIQAEQQEDAQTSNTGANGSNKQAVDNHNPSSTDQPATNSSQHPHRKLTPEQIQAMQQSINQARSAMLIPGLISLAIFAFGVVSPFANIAPFTFGRFQR